MATGFTNLTTLPHPVNVKLSAKLLHHALPTLVLGMFAEQYDLPKGDGKVLRTRRPTPFTANTVPLAEGITPPPTQLEMTSVDVTIGQYGAWTGISDQIVDFGESHILNTLLELHGENIGRTMEQVDYGVVRAGTSVAFANGANRAAVNTALTLPMQQRVVRTLQRNKAVKIREVLSASGNYATKAIEAAYVAITHTDVARDIRALPGFTPVSQYASGKAICPEEIGSVDDVRYILSADLAPFADAGGLDGDAFISTTGTNCDVYPILYMGKHAWGRLKTRGMGVMSPTVRNPSPQAGDELGQRGSVGCKYYHAAFITNQLWMVRLEVAATL